jgi:hypothetical protein
MSKSSYKFEKKLKQKEFCPSCKKSTSQFRYYEYPEGNKLSEVSKIYLSIIDPLAPENA